MSTTSKFIETEIGEIPSDWESVHLGKVCSKIGSGITPRGAKKVYKDSGITLIRSQNVHNNSFHKDGLVYIDEVTAKEMENVTVNKNDILLNITGDSVARCCAVPDDIQTARVNQHVSIIRTKEEELNPIFLRYYLTTPRMQELMLSLAQSGGTRNALTKGMIEEFAVPKPRMEEQIAIAKILSSIDAKVELYQQMNNTLEAIGQTIFKHWFINFEFPDENGKPYKSSGGEMVDSELGMIPKRWKVGVIADLAKNEKNAIVDGPFGTQMKIEEYTLEGIPIIEMEYLEGLPFYKPFNKFISEQKYEEVKRSVVRPGDIIISKTGTLGLLGIMTDLYKKSIIVSRLAKITPNIDYGKFYLFFILKQLQREKYWDHISSGSTMPIINLTHIKSKNVVIPSKEVLKIYEEILISIYNKIFYNSVESRTLLIIRDSLLPKLMSGKIRVPLSNNMS